MSKKILPQELFLQNESPHSHQRAPAEDGINGDHQKCTVNGHPGVSPAFSNIKTGIPFNLITRLTKSTTQLKPYTGEKTPPCWQCGYYGKPFKDGGCRPQDINKGAPYCQNFKHGNPIFNILRTPGVSHPCLKVPST